MHSCIKVIKGNTLAARVALYISIPSPVSSFNIIMAAG